MLTTMLGRSFGQSQASLESQRIDPFVGQRNPADSGRALESTIRVRTGPGTRARNVSRRRASLDVSVVVIMRDMVHYLWL